MLCFPPKGKNCYIFVHAFPPESPGQENPYRTNPIQSRSTLHEFTLMFSPKGKTSVTYYSFLLSSSEKTPAQSHPPEKTAQKKQRGITIKISEPEQEKTFVGSPSENEAQKKTPVADLFKPLNIWNGMEIRGIRMNEKQERCSCWSVLSGGSPFSRSG